MLDLVRRHHGQAGGQRHRHRGVEPEPVVVDRVGLEVVGEQHPQGRDVVVMEAGRATVQMRPQHLDARARVQTFQRVRCGALHRLLQEDHREAPRQPRQQLLGTLVDEIPAQMGKDDECGHDEAPAEQGMRGRRTASSDAHG